MNQPVGVPESRPARSCDNTSLSRWDRSFRIKCRCSCRPFNVSGERPGREQNIRPRNERPRSRSTLVYEYESREEPQLPRIALSLRYVHPVASRSETEFPSLPQYAIITTVCSEQGRPLFLSIPRLVLSEFPTQSVRRVTSFSRAAKRKRDGIPKMIINFAPN